MAGFNMETDAVQNELTALEASLTMLKDSAMLDGVIDDDEQADIDDLEDLIAQTRNKISELVEMDAPPPSIALEPEPGTMEHDAAQQAAEAANAVAASAARSARDGAAAEDRQARKAAEEAARAKAKAAEQCAHLLGEASMREITADDLASLSPDALRQLYSDLKKASDSDNLDWMGQVRLYGNSDAVKGALTAADGPVTD